MKINTLTEDIERINIFEKKLRIITGLDNVDMKQSLYSGDKEEPAKNEKDENIDEPSPYQSKEKSSDSCAHSNVFFSISI